MSETDFGARKALVRVSVHAPGGAHYEKEAHVVLVRGDERIALERTKGRSVYEGVVAPGVYRLKVSAEALVSPSRTVEVRPEGKTASAYLGKEGWPYYRLGENIVPFEPHEDLVAVAFPVRPPDMDTAQEQVKRLLEKLPLKPYEFGESEELPFTAAEGAIWLFHLTEPPDPDLRRQVIEEVRKLLGEDARVGIPVDLTPHQVKVIDSHFVVRFRDHLKPQDIEALVEEVEGRIVRGFIQAGNARLVEFLRGDYRDHLRIVEEWYRKELLVYGEPDVMTALTDDVFPATAPDDPTYPSQANLTLQEADHAWQYLHGIAADLTLGSPDVYVMTLDRGVDIDHPDIGGNLTDGTAQLAQCYDFSGLRACTVPGYTPDTSHGMGVYGIIAALTDNASAIAGIAPNVHQIGLERPTLTSVNYPDVLLWAAGFTTGNPSAGWPAEPISPGADILSCSHGRDGLALSGIMDDTFQYLATYGRGGKGTLVIYSAGNGGTAITGFRTWAAHPRTMAISNSEQPDALGVERLRTAFPGPSNFGPEIDICAQGTDAPSLNRTGGEQTFGGTSAAAPTVAAAAALMLSVEPSLTWINLRDILRDTAQMIDPANGDPAGQWVGGFSQWYGFGRLNINDAVRGADDLDPGAVNLVIRDNLADDGTVVPTGGTFWHSPDIWVRTSDPTGTPAPAYNAHPPDEPAQGGVDNWVRVRVKNGGTAGSSNYYVRLYLTHFAGAEFQYPSDYIPSINSGDPIPSPLVQGTYLLGERFVTGLAAGDDETYTFLWPAAMVPPEFVGGTKWHPCLLAEVTPHTGPGPVGNLVVGNTNLGQRNVTIDYGDDDGGVFEMTGVIGHAGDDASMKRLVVHRGKLPKKAKIWVRFLDKKVELATLERLREQGNRSVVVDEWQDRRVFRLTSGSTFVLDVPMVAGPLTPVVLGAWVPPGMPKHEYEVALLVLSRSKRVLGAFSLAVVIR